MIEARVERIGHVDISLGLFDFMEMDIDGDVSLWRFTSDDPKDPAPDVVLVVEAVENHGLRRRLWVRDPSVRDAAGQPRLYDQPFDRLSILPAGGLT